MVIVGKNNGQTYLEEEKKYTLLPEYGKKPPQAIELEEAVLGAILLETNAIIEIIDVLKPESFYNEKNKIIYQAALNLSRELKPIDILTVSEELKKLKKLEIVGGYYYISFLTSKVASTVHIEYHARIIQQKFIQRELIRISSLIQEKAYDESIDIDNLLDFSEKELFNITEGNIKKETAKINTILDEAIQLIEEASKRKEGLNGVPSGFTELDRITSGWQNSDLIIIAARPSIGKTAFSLSMLRNIAISHKLSVAMFSLEMSSVQLVNRLIVSETELASEKIKNGKLQAFEWEQLNMKIKTLEKADIFIDDTPSMSIFELRAKCRRLKARNDIKIILIDYLQLMNAGTDNRFGNREQEVSIISRSLKALAKELNIPVIALSQLNRSVETRSGDKRPQLSDLRESGSIEQDSDMVLFIHRPEKYGLTEDEDGNSTKGLAEIIIAKHRNGAVGTVNLKFTDHLAKFTDFEDTAGVDNFDENISSKMNEDFDDINIPENNDNFNLNNFEFENPPF